MKYKVFYLAVRDDADEAVTELFDAFVEETAGIEGCLDYGTYTERPFDGLRRNGRTIRLMGERTDRNGR